MEKSEIVQRMENTASDIITIDTSSSNTAVALIEKKIATHGKNKSFVTYSDLVEGIEFSFENINNGEPFFINRDDWSGLNRAIIGTILAHISVRSFKQHDFIANVLVVNSLDCSPSDHFFNWMKHIGIIKGTQSEVFAFWADHAKRAFNYFKHNDSL